MEDFAKIIKRMNAIADSGLIYAKDIFDRERYTELKELASDLTENLTDLSKSELTEAFRPTAYYPTPMIDVRAFVRDEAGGILLIRDRVRNDWAMPGGYGEIGLTAKEDVLKELLEEAGLTGTVNRLLAIFDTEKWQPQARQYYKFVFECSVISGEFTENSETTESHFFDFVGLSNLNLSEHRNTYAQFELLEKLAKENKQHID